MAEFYYPDELCNGESFSILNFTYGDAPFSYAWDFGNGDSSFISEPTYAYTGLDSSQYLYPSVTITNALGCSFTFEDTIFVSVPQLSLVTSIDSSLNCPPVLSTIHIDNYEYYDEFLIDFGDGDSVESFVDLTDSLIYHTYEYPGTYNISIIATDTLQCQANSEIDSSFVIGGPIAEFDYEVLNECPPLEVEFEITFTESVHDFLWVFGDGNIDSISPAINTYLNAGSFYPVLVVQDSVSNLGPDTIPCTVAYVGEELFIDGPILNFELSEDTLCFGGGEVEILNLTYNPDNDNITNWTWDFGDGTGSNDEDPGEHTYTNSGSYIISLQAETDEGCVYYFEKLALVVLDYPELFPFLEYEQDCPLMPVQFFSDSLIDPEIIDQIEWNFGDGQYSNEMNPLYEYEEGSYAPSVTYTLYSCPFVYDLSDSLETYPTPTADFVYYPDLAQGLNHYIFENTSSGESSISWWIDSLAMGQEEFLYLEMEDELNVLYLIAENEFGCLDTSFITLSELFSSLVPNVITVNDDGINDFFVIPLKEAVDCLDLSIYNRWGNLVYRSHSYQNEWNGRDMDGNLLSEGTYYYIAKVCGASKMTGYISLIR